MSSDNTDTESRIINPDISLSDESFNKNKTADYCLNMQLSFNDFTYAIYDKSRNKYVSFEHYKSDKIYNHYQLNNKLEELIKHLSWLRGAFNRCNLIYINNKSTLIPVPLYSEEEQETYFNFNHTLEDYEELCCDKLKSLNAYNLYTIPQNIKLTIRDLFQNCQIYHHITSLVETLLLSGRNNSDEKKVYVNVNTSLFDLIYLEGNKLMYSNTFEYFSKEDFTYYVLFALQQLKQNPNSIEVILTGEIQRNTELFDVLFKYIRNLTFIKRNDAFEYSYVFDKLFPNYYYNLLNMNLLRHKI